MLLPTALPRPVSLFRPLPLHGWLGGLLLCALLAVIAKKVAALPWIHELGVSVLPLAILLGMLVGNLATARLQGSAAGIQFAKGPGLRLGIILFGFHLTTQELLGVGWNGFVLAATVLALTFLLSLTVGTRVLGLDRNTSILVGAGSAICGAAAILAAEPVLRARSEQVAVAVASVVLFGTVAMFLYPVLFPYLGLSEIAYGRFAGATIHEVAQVVVAGEAVSQVALHAAVVEKMLRVMLLAPFLLLLSAYVARSAFRQTKDTADATNAQRENQQKTRITIPWFALGFVAVVGLNSLQIVPTALVETVLQLDAFLLAMAMAALGLCTRVSDIRQAGWRPMLLAALASCFLLAGGYGLTLYLVASH